MDGDTSLTEGVEPIAILEDTAAATAAATPPPGVNGSAGAAAGGVTNAPSAPRNTHGRHIAISSPSSRVASSSSDSFTSASGSPASMLGILGSPSSMTPRTRARHADVAGLLQRLQAKAENTHSTLLSHRRSIELHEKTIENHESLHAELTGARLQTALRMIVARWKRRAEDGKRNAFTLWHRGGLAQHAATIHEARRRSTHRHQLRPRSSRPSSSESSVTFVGPKRGKGTLAGLRKYGVVSRVYSCPMGGCETFSARAIVFDTTCSPLCTPPPVLSPPSPLSIHSCLQSYDQRSQGKLN